MEITISTTVDAPLDAVWRAWTTPADIMAWNAASDEWHTPAAEIDPRAGGRFTYRMEARDGSVGFDFCGAFTEVVPQERIAFTMDDDRPVTVTFSAGEGGVTVTETFTAEDENDGEMQRQGWLAILERFRRHVEGSTD